MAGLALLSGYSSDSSSADEANQPEAKPKQPQRKAQIKIESLPKTDDVPKARSTAASKPSGSKHSLFGMLPPPKRPDSQVLAEREQKENQRRAARRPEETDEQEEEVQTSRPVDVFELPSLEGKAKNNDSFRAMLGLKGSAPAGTSASDTSPTQTRSIQPEIRSAPALAESLPKPKSTPSFQISAAPAITSSPSPPAPTESVSEENPGWQLVPDGSWVPVTPEAQAQYHAYLASTLSTPAVLNHKRKRASDNFDGTRDLLNAGIDPNDIETFDASLVASAAHAATTADAAETDKYAAAAEFAAGNREATAPKPGHLRGLRRGQLSTLVNMANENRSALEQKWQRGREARSRAGNQYGF